MSHRSQILGVAERLGWPYQVKEIDYNRLAGLANGPFGARLWHLSGDSRKSITAPWPDLVIAAGRRSAPAALAVKKRARGSKAVQLMWPDMAPTRFDLIAAPEHDTLSYKGPNLMRTFGAPHRVTAAVLQDEAARWHPRIAHLPQPWITLLVGGSTKDMPYETADFKTLAAYATAEAERLGGSLLITTSPRTDAGAQTLIKNLLTVPNAFHTFTPGGDNPYLGFLGLADALIVTGDSVSMCSEACATLRPVYIFVPPHLGRDPHRFREELIARGHAKPHTYPIRLDWRPVPMPDAAQRVADAIKTLMA